MTPEERRNFDESNERWERQQKFKEERRELVDRLHAETMRGTSVTLASGRSISLDGYDDAFLWYIRQLDPLDIMTLFGITAADAARYVERDYDRRCGRAKMYLLGVCIWRETGDLYDFEDAEMNRELFGTALKRRKLLSAVMRGKLPEETLDRIIAAFEANHNPLRLME